MITIRNARLNPSLMLQMVSKEAAVVAVSAGLATAIAAPAVISFALGSIGFGATGVLG